MRNGTRQLLIRTLQILAVLFFCVFGVAQTAKRDVDTKAFVESTTHTALRFLPLVQGDAKDQNIAFSPLGFTYSAALLQNGADEIARKEIWDVFGFGAMSPEELNRQAIAVKNRIVPPPTPENKARKGDEPPPLPEGGWNHRASELVSVVAIRYPEHFSPAFLKVAQGTYDAELVAFRKGQFQNVTGKATLGSVDLPSGLLASIGQFDFLILNKVRAACNWNGWHASEGPLPEIWVDHVSPRDTIRHILDPSSIPDPKEQPKPQPIPKATFTVPGGAEVKVALIEKKDGFLYYRGEGFQTVTTNCGDFLYNILLPDEDKSVDWLERNLTAESLAESQRRSQDATMRVYMPEFRIEQEREFTKYLRELGMGYSFSNLAAFVNLVTNPGGARLSKAGQKAYVKVDKNGIAAEAITYWGGVVGGIAVGPPPPPPPMIVVNRPYLFTITHADTHALLFMGAVHDPRVGFKSENGAPARR